MRLIYIANIRLPTEKAHGVQIMKMCEAFALLGNKVVLIVPQRHNVIQEDPFLYYNTKKVFTIIRVPSIDLVRFGVLGFWIQNVSFLFASLFALFSIKGDVFYTRDELIACVLSFIGKQVVWETHTKKKNALTSGALSRVTKIVTLTRASKDYYVKEFSAPQSKILVAPDAVDVNSFNLLGTKREIRSELDLPINVKIIGYVGKYKTMGETKGVDGIIEAFSKIQTTISDTRLMIAGLNSDEVPEVEQMCKNMHVPQEKLLLFPHIKFSMIPKYLKSCDVLVMNYPNTDHYARFMSPLKLFEYMASGVPIVSSDLPSVREVLNEKNAYLFEAGDLEKFKQTLNNALFDHVSIEKINKQAMIDVQKYTWQKRAEKILSII